MSEGVIFQVKFELKVKSQSAKVNCSHDLLEQKRHSL